MKHPGIGGAKKGGFAGILLALALFGSVFGSACTSVTGPKGWAAPASLDGTIVAAQRNHVFAVATDSGDIQWQFPPAGDKKTPLKAVYGALAMDSSRIYVPGYDKAVYALDCDTGAPVWTFKTKDFNVGGIALSNDTAYFGSDDGKLRAVNSTNGALQWEFDTGGEIWSTPAVADGTVYVTSQSGKTFAVDARTGQEKWQFSANAGIPGSPVVSGGRVYFGALDTHIYALDAATGEKAWDYTASNWVMSRPLVQNGIVYVADLNGNVYALNSNGQLVWGKPFDAKAPVRSAAVLAGGQLVVVNEKGVVYGIDPQTGAGTWGPVDLAEQALADPLVIGNDVIIDTAQGRLVFIDASSGAQGQTITLNAQ